MKNKIFLLAFIPFLIGCGGSKDLGDIIKIEGAWRYGSFDIKGEYCWCGHIYPKYVQTNTVIPEFVDNYSITQACWLVGYQPNPGIESIDFGQKVKYLGRDKFGFQNFTELKSIKISDNLEQIHEGCFEGCTSLVLPELPATLAYVGKNAFKGCTKITNFNIPNGVTDVTNYYLYGWEELKSITIPDSVQTVPPGAGGLSINGFLKNCKNLESCTYTNGCSYIPDNCFVGCEKLSSFTIPSSVNYIGDWAFQRTTSLKSITIPSTVKKIGTEAFKGSGLTSVTFENPNNWYYYDPSPLFDPVPVKVDLSDPAEAAAYLTAEECPYIFQK